MLVLLGPLACADLRAQSLPEVYFTDASDWGTAAVRAKIPLHFARELPRHCLSRGNWSKLLSPWQSWLKEHEMLFPEDEAPDGVPLVSHPLWTELAETLPCTLVQRKESRQRHHINVLELKSVLELEKKLSYRYHRIRYLLGADSQVGLSCLCKGRSSSPILNEMLQSSLGIYLGAGLNGNYGFVPSNANPSDDPTRNRPLRAPSKNLPSWWHSMLVGDFREFDEWLSSIDFDPLVLAELPFTPEKEVSVSAVKSELLDRLRDVQKKERLELFDQKFGKRVESVSPLVDSKKSKETKREHQESDDQTKSPEKSLQKSEVKRPHHHFVASKEGVAPPQGKAEVQGSDEVPLLAASAVGASLNDENVKSPYLSAECLDDLRLFAHHQFFAPGGRRAKPGFVPTRKGFLDLYSGNAGVARKLSRKYKVWVLTFDFERGEEQNLLDKQLQQRLKLLISAGAFLGVGAAPECASFSRAVTPAVRSRDFPLGLKNISVRMAEKVRIGNLHAEFTFGIITLCIALSLPYWLENPDGSFLWLLPQWMASGICSGERAYRFDMCHYKTAWRKRTRIITNTLLQNKRVLCCGGHTHQTLRGRSTTHRASWTRVAQAYPRGLCDDLAYAMAAAGGLLAVKLRRSFLSGVAKCGDHLRIGEAKNPGPWGHRKKLPRDPQALLGVCLVEPATQKLQLRIWELFSVWLDSHLTAGAKDQVFLCGPLAVQLLRRFGLHLYESGGQLYEFRHLCVIVQQRFPWCRPLMSPAWQLLNQWEELSPVVHRQPLPEVLYKSMVAAAMFLGWRRFAGCLVLAMEGITRIGEVLRATRGELLLPRELFDPDSQTAFLQVKKPKTARRGKGRVQHCSVRGELAVKFLDAIFGGLEPFLKLYPLSANSFRTKWTKLLLLLKIPKHLHPTPASVRGGGSVMAYRRGESIQSIMWRMRLVSQGTLESYLQELAADQFLLTLPDSAKCRIRFLAALYIQALSLG